MTFFNKQEGVFDVEITKFGQFLLSQGKFKPTYYAFFDDDILYDASYAYVTESQNTTETRIEETPRPRTQYLFSGVETNYNLRKQMTGEGGNLIVQQHDADNMPGGSTPLGRSKHGEQKYPAWDIRLFDVELTRANITNTGSYLSYKTCPELDLLCQVFTGDSETLKPADHGGIDGRITIASEHYKDGSYLVLNSDELLLRIDEKNTDFQSDNFEVEVYEITSYTLKNGTTPEKAKSLMFTTNYAAEEVASEDLFTSALK